MKCLTLKTIAKLFINTFSMFFSVSLPSSNRNVQSERQETQKRETEREERHTEREGKPRKEN